MVYNVGTNDHPLGEISLKVNDNAYHVVRFHRFGYNSSLQIDDYNVQTSHPSGKMLQCFPTGDLMVRRNFMETMTTSFFVN